MAKQIYYKTCFNIFKSDAKNTWKTITEILSKSKTITPLPKYFKEGESMIIAELDIANKFNNFFFTNIGNDLASKIKYQGQNDYSRYLNKSINGVFTFKPVEAELISETIKNLPNKNSCGCDGINTNLLKIIEPAITKPLTILINQVLHVGVFPDKLNIAKVIPIYKKGDKRIFGNYRPISLLPTISKVLERII